jgi:hypothetical protein
MDGDGKRNERLIALCLLGFLLFNYPVLALFNRAALVAGIPVVYAYIFAAWALLIALIALVVRRANAAASVATGSVAPRSEASVGAAFRSERTADSSLPE